MRRSGSGIPNGGLGSGGIRDGTHEWYSPYLVDNGECRSAQVCDDLDAADHDSRGRLRPFTDGNVNYFADPRRGC